MSDLEILEERVLVSIPRGNDEELRVSIVRARKPDGGAIGWTSLRVFFRREDGSWCPGKAGITIRARELAGVAVAIAKAASCGTSPEHHAAAPARARAPEHRQTNLRQPTLPVAPPPIPDAELVDDGEIF